jgi:hypothetical protein
MSMVVCPSCRGAKAGFGVACGPKGCRPGRFTCDFCKGEGQVSAEANERWRKGEGLRRARIERGLTLSEEAAILRVDPVVLNDIEHGRCSAAELNNRLLEEVLQWPTIARAAGGR